MNKNEFRHRFRNYRKALTETQRFSASAAICDQLKAFLIEKRPGFLLTYLATKNEANVDSLLSFAQSLGISVYAPAVEAEALSFRPLHSLEQIQVGDFGIREPAPGKPLNLEALNESKIIALVPGVVFNLHGERLGQGGGFYDRFLPTLPANAITVGVCFDCQLTEQKLPTDDWDCRVNCIASESFFHQII